MRATGRILYPLQIFLGQKIVDVSIESLVIELVGSQSKLEAFLRMLKDVEILELARTGLTGLSRGTFDVKMYDEDGRLMDNDFSKA